jgi:adenosylcobinamide kinase/adenosylcobinamide-phosphate guanylyltransferase
MITLVIGGSCSGKSEYAEQCLDHVPGEKIYLATMIAADEESLARVRRHREKRSGRGFRTIECPRMSDLAAGDFPPGCNVLLEGIGTLAANELFPDGGWQTAEEDVDAAKRRILTGVKELASGSNELIIVSDEVNRAGCVWEGDTKRYQRLVGEVNQELCILSDTVIEMVCGLAVKRKAPGQRK